MDVFDVAGQLVVVFDVVMVAVRRVMQLCMAQHERSGEKQGAQRA